MIDFKELAEKGYTEFTANESEFRSVLDNLGTLIPSRINGPKIDLIEPKTKEEAHPQSLSAIYGISALPFHTDGAYFKIPPKFILLRCIRINSQIATPTVLIDPLQELKSELKQWLEYETWKVYSRSGIFYISILNSKIVDDHILRYDPVCMNPAYDGEAKVKLHSIFNKCRFVNIEWIVNKTLILNNWRILHARPTIEENEKILRTLQRAMIK